MSNTGYLLSAEEERVAERTQGLLSGEDPEPLAEVERNGMRAFLQRGETRLSTYQRVGGVFLNGAGLLVLLPGLARESVYSTVKFALTDASISAKFLLLPWILSTLVPLYALVLLLRDIVQFYFSPHFLESDPIRINRFALAGVTFPYDEGLEAKAQVIAQKVSDPNYANFILGGTSAKTIEVAHRQSKAGKAAFPLRLKIMQSLDRHLRTVEISSAEKIGVALSLAGSLDLSLVGEVARMEASVARHVLMLRKLVLRYTKALILFVWTTLISIAISAVLEVPSELPGKVKAAIVLFVYAFWALSSIFLIRLPLRWIDRLVPPPKADSPHGQITFRDPDLQEFELIVTRLLAGGAIVCGVLALLAILVG